MPQVSPHCCGKYYCVLCTDVSMIGCCGMLFTVSDWNRNARGARSYCLRYKLGVELFVFGQDHGGRLSRPLRNRLINISNPPKSTTRKRTWKNYWLNSDMVLNGLAWHTGSFNYRPSYSQSTKHKVLNKIDLLESKSVIIDRK